MLKNLLSINKSFSSAGPKTRLPRLIHEALSLLPAVPALAISATLLPTDSAVAAIVLWTPNIVIPNNIDGLYINVETRIYSSAAGLSAGWDLNPYGTSTTAMSWFAAQAPSGAVMGLGQGGTTTAVASLSNGTIVGPASTFGNTASSVTAGGWVLNADNNFGFRFLGADAQTHYGYGVFAVGATMGVRTLKTISFDTTPGVAITIGGSVPGSVPVSDRDPSTALSALLATGAAGLWAVRRRRLAA